MRAVLYTNVVVSALIRGGKPLALFRAATESDLLLYTSPDLLDELSDVLKRNHLASRLGSRRSSVEQAVALYARLAHIIEPTTLPVAISRDPDDDAVLALAVSAQADFVVSGVVRRFVQNCTLSQKSGYDAVPSPKPI